MEIMEKKLKERFGGRIKTGVLLKNYTSMGVGGLADYFYTAENIEELVTIADFAYKEKIPFIIIGSGTNVVPSDYGFDGIVIQNKTESIVINKENGEVIADSGLSLGKLLMLAASNDLGGIEYLAGMPGTLGGAVHNNAQNIGDYVKSITLLEVRSKELKIARHEANWMNFTYRSTKLKSEYKNKTFNFYLVLFTFGF